MRDFDDPEFKDMKGITVREIHRREVMLEDRDGLSQESLNYSFRSQSSSFQLEEQFTDRVIREEVIGYVEAMKGLSIERPDSFGDLHSTLMDLMEKNLVRRVIYLDDRMREYEEIVLDE